MVSLVNKYVKKTDFESYEDFVENFKIDVPENFNFAYDIVDEYAKIAPEKTAIIWCDDNNDEKIFTFKDMKKYSDKAANFFLKHGIKKGDTVMLTLKSRYEFWFCMLGLHKIGAVAIPATHMLTTKDIVYRIEKAGLKMIVCIGENGVPEYVDEAVSEINSNVLKACVVNLNNKNWIDFSKELEESSEEFTRPVGEMDTKNEDVLVAYFSSGTTGYPKLIQHDHEYPLGHITTAKYWQNVEDDGLHYTVADSGWAKCIWGKLYGQWIAGTAVFVYDYDRFDAGNMLEKIAKYKITTFCAPPTIYRFMIKQDISKVDFSSLHYAVTAGEPLNPEVYNKFLEFTSLRLMEGFGQTETVVSVANFPWMDPKPGSMGKPVPIFDLMIKGSDGKECDVGEEGELVFKTKDGKPLGLFSGYFKDPERTKKSWYDGYYHTGDTAWKDEDGFLWFVGRNDDLIKSSGYRIGPFEVESALISHPAVLECAITGVPDPVRGQIVKATIVLTGDYEASEELKKELQDHVKHNTAPYKYPRAIDFVKELPKTISGKIRRVEIREQDEEKSNN
ncbi:AMP-dependent synthetase and ligase [Methanococcus maripaludis C5]|uniref:AMP-dependent synthetase and ligase n=1 Tax=Methanococcus maripaludis (strain C5 / ATCC BAA-1333) TaxID=402880 RepID=A4FWQ8_METM5|nr:AMP-binding protein [Methanococcus maripaludis]ABO34633.1 AMP-dependent synthetase and ligase [Methanococcus maripaludis C5]